MIFKEPLAARTGTRAQIQKAYRANETAAVEHLLTKADLSAKARAGIVKRAGRFVEAVRKRTKEASGLESFLKAYGLSSAEGVALLCLAEALLRIPDAETADRLIHDKIATADWAAHLGGSDSLFVNASTWALMLTGRFVRLGEDEEADVASLLGRLVTWLGEPVVREAIAGAMRILVHQFVLGRTMGEALERSQEAEERGIRHSYDRLGEAALTAKDAMGYFEAYAEAIASVGRVAAGKGPMAGPGISVKLSALHPRYEFAEREGVSKVLGVRLFDLAELARAQGIGLTVDAEEADRLELSLDLFERVHGDDGLRGWEGFGLAVQAYQKRSLPLLDWLIEIANARGRRVPVRLVKGAYWDQEIKRAQVGGFEGYPVFTRKLATDVSYLACARRILAAGGVLYPQFATHNAHTLAAVLELAGDSKDYEFQRLHGMGELLYDVVKREGYDIPVRIYAPVGSHEDLLPYLVRRLLENGANTSFVNRTVDAELPVTEVVADPVPRLRALEEKPHPRIPLPRHLFGEGRENAAGLDLSDPLVLADLAPSMAKAVAEPWEAAPLVAGNRLEGKARAVTDPADRRRRVGSVVEADGRAVDRALHGAAEATGPWDATGAEARAAILERAAGLLEENRAALMALCVREGGKTIPDALAEVREAVDYCRYYGVQARSYFSRLEIFPGPTGEANTLSLHGRGVFACISPWNFPLAIFLGQVTAALAAGNAVLAKPAEQTPLVADFALRLLHRAGVPADVLHLLPGNGEVGAKIIEEPRINGVAFTGSTETAQAINRVLARRDGPIVPLIAETGGQNAMIVDSSALAEQVVADVVTSAFRSVGQRCSALRVLFLQDAIAPKMIEMLTGAMEELVIGDPALLSTDVGPVIDADAQRSLEDHAKRMRLEGKALCELKLPEGLEHGTFFAPSAFEIERLDLLPREVFGPILHVLRFSAAEVDGVVDAINGTGYGLTLGIHSRIDTTVRRIANRARVGNVYVNRSMIGAVVGVQPFGGEGLSGTGPKAGGPRYLNRFFRRARACPEHGGDGRGHDPLDVARR